MSRHWKERLDPEKHQDYMSGSMVLNVEPSKDNLIERWAYLVRVCGFTFHFVSVSQVRECLDHFSRKIHPSGRYDKLPPGSHWYHPWYERLPMWLFEESKRVRVVMALRQALAEFESENVPAS
jgi:hypothetical protein